MICFEIRVYLKGRHVIRIGLRLSANAALCTAVLSVLLDALLH